jgi:hypothetical protein
MPQDNMFSPFFFDYYILRSGKICIELMALTKKSFSALEMQRMMEHKEYLPIWYIMHKIRRVMSISSSKHKLNGCIEFDEGFLSEYIIRK